ncbi:uncharacterized protein YbjT (DUF2867 family) [Haloactinospora alba]|uniref:Uncharacterized protein YbjT (DUF2867 family) n=1 Tax=Haloactinospora alba TaxID=405555 RepID=A0A543NEE9_9ACTN|nr:NAD(P)H-binding protein [Haloactinospora alba]TQN30196.1 uncharacterized protein YbjT (DUF2867 family) [Haloactinospora alba]
MAARGKILVTGATGNVGHHIVSQLRARGTDFRVLTRDPASAALPDGVEAVGGDLASPQALEPALEGVDTVFLLWPFPSADGVEALIDTIARHARRVVYFSAMGAPGEPEPETPGVWGRIERAIRDAGLEWTFLRVGGLAVNTLGWADDIRRYGAVRWSYGGAGRSLVHERDVADVAVLALTEEGHTGSTYNLTGPEVLTQAEQARTIGEAIGSPVRWEELSREETRQRFLAHVGDPGFAEQALDTWAAMVDNPEPVTADVAEVTGRPARTFREWAVDHAEDFLPAAATV